MAFDAFDRSIELIRVLAPLTQRLRRHDTKLTKQLRDAAGSISANLREGAERVGADRRHFFRIALGSASEVGAHLEVAAAWGYLAPSELTAAHALLDRIRAMTWRLAR